MIRTIEQAEKEYLATYYRCDCEYCKGQFVVSIDDINQYFFGKPTVANDEYAWKCPTCGHVNTGKNIDLTPCYQNGKNNIVFELSEEGSKKVRDFQNAHTHAGKDGITRLLCQPNRFEYTLDNTDFCNCKKIKCNECGEESKLE